MKTGVRLTGVLAFVLAASVVSPAAAQSELLKTAVDLFDRQDYVAAQEALNQVDRDGLSADERAKLDRLLSVVPTAIQGGEKAKQVMAKADAGFDAGRWDEADRLYRAVLQNQYASSGQRKEAGDQRKLILEKKRLAEAAKPSGPVRQASYQEAPTEAAAPLTQRLTIVEEQRRIDALRWQRAVAKMNDLATKAREAVAASDFEKARGRARQAIQAIESARTYAEPASKYEARKAEALALGEEVSDAQREFAEKTAGRQRDEIAKRLKERTAMLERQRREKIEQLFNTASQLRKEQRFTEAAEVVREILRIDPGNARAQDQYLVMEDYASIQIQAQGDRERDYQFRRTTGNSIEALTPWAYDVLYPSNWLELEAKRRGLGVSSFDSTENLELNRTLDQVLPEFLYQETPFEAVIENLSKAQQVNLLVDWEDLDAHAVERDKPLSFQLRNITFRTALQAVLAQVGGDVTLAFSIGDGLIRIASKAKLDEDKMTLVYDIRDLLVEIPRFTNAAFFDPSQGLNRAAQGIGGLGFGHATQLFESENIDENEVLFSDNGVATKIMDIMRETIEPDSWRETGGGDGSIRELNGQLIVFNTSDAQRQVADLLTQLRETRALQISIETRFLTVSSNFLEEIGVDLDFVLNSGSAGYDRAFNTGGIITDAFTGAPILIPRPFSQIGNLPAVPVFGVPLGQATGILQPFGAAGLVPPNGGISPHFNELTPISIQQSSLALTNPAGFNTGVPGSFANAVGLSPALSIAGSFLDNLQIDFLIRATQANSRSSVVQAPRLLMFNGQRANITVGRARQYVSSVTPALAEGVVGFTPIINQATSGTSLDVEGTISADRKYVTVTVRATQTKEPQFERFEVQRASGNSPGVFVTLLDQEFATVNTTVSIPDGGTVLLGGLKQVGEVEVEAGVPILSKIPILKRAFTNTTTIKDTQTLLILLKAKIIIQKEAEDEAFPSFVTAGS